MNSQGELKERLGKLLETEYPLKIEVLAGIRDLLDEAKKEFPEWGFGDNLENASIDGLNKTVAWFRKWFGGGDK